MTLSKKIPISEWRRAVIKVGSALIAEKGKRCSTKYLLPIASFINKSLSQGKEIILVSSGAVAAGLATQPRLLAKSVRSIPEKQALAAIGQSQLMATWSRFFDFPCAQLLLTYDDIYNRKRFVNAKNTLTELLRLQTLPIVNENDTVAVDELKVGDNDNLAAYVAVLAEADLLIICTDIDGLYEADPQNHPDARFVAIVEKIDQAIYRLAGNTKGPMGTGGMLTKIEAADKATSRGIETIIINGTQDEYLDNLQKGFLLGTLFKKRKIAIASKKHWMLYILPSRGRIVVDRGAARALMSKGASLLPSGVVDVEGEFTNGDAVGIVLREDEQIREIAKGLTQYGARDLQKIKGKQSSEIESVLGYFFTDVVIHRDDMVLISR